MLFCLEGIMRSGVDEVIVGRKHRDQWRLISSYLLIVIGVFSVIIPAENCAREARQERVGGVKQKAVAEKTSGERSEEEQREGGNHNHAQLPTDPSIQLFIRRARDFIESQQYELAIRVLQRALDEGQRVLVRTAPKTYKTVSRSAQDMLMDLPVQAFGNYRAFADAEAEALLEQADAPRNPDMLREVVRRFFLSSYGAQAAYQLACLQINQGEFSAAVRLLRRIREYHLDYPVDRTELLARLAVAQMYAGERKAARQTYDVLSDEYEEGVASADLERLGKDLSRAEPATTSGVATTHWRTDWHGSTQVGVAPAPALPSAVEGKRRVVSLWETGHRKSQTPSSGQAASRRMFLEQMWTQKDYHPANQLVWSGDKVWVSTPSGIQCLNKSSGRRLWFATGKAPVQEIGEGENKGRRRRMNLPEFVFFKDYIGGRFSRVNGMIVRVEGNWRTARHRRRVRRGKRRVYVTEQEGSYLTAYDEDTGKMRWSMGGGQADGEKVLAGVRFMCAPVSSGSKLLVAAELDDGLYLVALSPRDGSLIWQQSLCSYTTSPSPPASPVGIAVRGGVAYVASGRGVVFALDAVTGEIYWARTYSSNVLRWRSRRKRDSRRKVSEPGGWAENVVIPVRDKLVVLPSDSSKMFCFDRSNGNLRYHKPRAEARYPLGILEDRLIVGGKSFVRAHRLENGEVGWDQSVDSSTGRAVLTEKYVFVPQKGTITVLDAESGRERIHMLATVGEEANPGNLYSDGQRLFTVGFDLTGALGPGKQFLAKLDERVKAQKTSRAYLARGKFFSRMGRYAAAVEDLRNAREIALEDPLQARFAELEKKLSATRDRISVIRSKLSWFGDDFNRGSLGSGYTVMKGTAKLVDGHVKMSGDKNMVLKLNKKIPGNFIAEIDGWQHERPCDLSFQLTIEGPEKAVRRVYAQFGSKWNKWNYISFSGDRVKKSNQYLIKKGEKHRLRLERIGNEIALYADGRQLVRYEGRRIPSTARSRTTLHLYGFGNPHFFDNLVIRRLDKNGNVKGNGDGEPPSENKWKSKLQTLEDRERELKRAMGELRERGYTRLMTIRRTLFENIVELLKQSPEEWERLLTEAQELADTTEEKMRLRLARVRAAKGAGDTKTAAREYFRLLQDGTDGLFQWDPEKPVLRTDLSLWITQRLSPLNEGEGESAKKAVRTVARHAYDKMSGKGDVSPPELYRFMRDCPDEEVAIQAGRSAARIAEKAGKVALAGLILRQMKEHNNARCRAAALLALAGLYRRQGWFWQARRTLEVLGDKYGKIRVNAGGQMQTGRSVRQKFLRELRDRADSPDQLQPEEMPGPPYKLVWKKDQSGYPMNHQIRGRVANQFLEEHLMLMGRRRRRIACVRIRDGEKLWQTSVDRRLRYVRRGNVLVIGGNQSKAISLLTGNVIWEQNCGDVRGRSRYRDRTSLAQNYIFSNETSDTESVMRAFDVVTGRERWRRQVWTPTYPHAYVSDQFIFRRIAGHNPRLAFYQVYDVRSGEPLEADVSLGYFGVNTVYEDEVVASQKGQFVLLSLRTGQVTWEIPVKYGRRIRVSNVRNSRFRVIQSGKKTVLIDPARHEVVWRLESQNAHYFHGFVYDFRREEIVALKREQQGDGSWTRVPWIIDAQTGEVVGKIATAKNKHLYMRRRRLRMNDDYLLTQWYKSEKRRGHTYRRSQYYCLVRRNDSEVLPDVQLPHAADVGGKKKRDGFRAAVVGDKIVFAGRGQILVYEHKDGKTN